MRGPGRGPAAADSRRAEQRLDPLAAQRPHLELYIRWMQEIRRFKPSTVSRRFSVTTGFYRTCVIDSVLGAPAPAKLRRCTWPGQAEAGPDRDACGQR